MYICGLIVEVMVTMSPDMQFHIMNDLGNLLVFFRKSSLYVSFEHSVVHRP